MVFRTQASAVVLAGKKRPLVVACGEDGNPPAIPAGTIIGNSEPQSSGCDVAD
jgi:hypothetical protein